MYPKNQVKFFHLYVQRRDYWVTWEVRGDLTLSPKVCPLVLFIVAYQLKPLTENEESYSLNIWESLEVFGGLVSLVTVTKHLWQLFDRKIDFSGLTHARRSFQALVICCIALCPGHCHGRRGMQQKRLLTWKPRSKVRARDGGQGELCKAHLQRAISIHQADNVNFNWWGQHPRSTHLSVIPSTNKQVLNTWASVGLLYPSLTFENYTFTKLMGWKVECF